MNIDKINKIFEKIENKGNKIIKIFFIIATFTLFFAIRNILEFFIVLSIIMLLISNLLKDTDKYKKIGNILMPVSCILITIEIIIILIIYFINNNMIFYIPIVLLCTGFIIYFLINKLIKTIKENN